MFSLRKFAVKILKMERKIHTRQDKVLQKLQARKRPTEAQLQQAIDIFNDSGSSFNEIAIMLGIHRRAVAR